MVGDVVGTAGQVEGWALGSLGDFPEDALEPLVHDKNRQGCPGEQLSRSGERSRD